MRTKNIFFCCLYLFCLTAAAQVYAQAPQPLLSVFSYLTAQEGAALTLEMDLTELINQKRTNQYFPAALSTADGRVFSAEVRARGKYRRKICDVPPLKLKFSKKTLREYGLDTLNEVKLVVPCFDDPKGEELVLREYVAYRLFQQISPQYHVRVGLVKVTFRDRHVEKDREPLWCLLLEHEEEVAARLNGAIVEAYNMPMDSFLTAQAADHALFQYLIGNTDWALSTFRNVYLLRPKSPGALMRVLPYDFDFSGLVCAPYALPASQSGLQSVKERLLMTDGLPQYAINAAATRFQHMQEQLLSISALPQLSKGARRDLSRYVESFFCGQVPQVEAAAKPEGKNLR